MAFKMKGFSGFKKVEEDKGSEKASSEVREFLRKGSGSSSRAPHQYYTSEQRNLMIKRGVAPKDRMAYAAKHFA
jgi:hypothetical protein